MRAEVNILSSVYSVILRPDSAATANANNTYSHFPRIRTIVVTVSFLLVQLLLVRFLLVQLFLVQLLLVHSANGQQMPFGRYSCVL